MISGITTRVSSDDSAVQGNGKSESPHISGDGRYVAFVSKATSFFSGDTNGSMDVLVRDLSAGAIGLVSAPSAAVHRGCGGLGWSERPSISGDGRYVAFASSAGNLVPGDTNWSSDVFVKDLISGITTRVSTDSSGVQGNDSSWYPDISGDGRYVAFNSVCNLTASDTHGIFVKDLLTGITTLASTDSSGIPFKFGVAAPSISDGGRYVAFMAGFSVYVKDMVSGVTTWASTGSAGYSWSSSISNDGRYVTFDSFSSGLFSDDTNNEKDSYVKDLVSGVTTRVSTDSSGREGNGGSTGLMISNEGRYAAFKSNASNLVLGDTNGVSDIFIKDLASGVTTRVSIDGSGVEGNGKCGDYLSISGDGRHIAFSSYASNLVSDDTNGCADIFVKDTMSGVIALVSTDRFGGQGNGDFYAPSISDDGQYVAFESYASNLSPWTTTALTDVFRVTNPLTNHSPIWISLTNHSVPENANSDSVIGTLRTTDLDGGQTFTYTLVDDAGGRFKIAGDQLLVDNGELDFETATSHTIRVRTTDQGGVGLSYEQDLVISISDINEAPTKLALSGSSVPEDSNSGTLVGRLSTIDPDVGDTFAYKLLDSAGGRFQIVGDRVLVDDGTLLDFETATSHTIRVRTTDQGGVTYEQDLAISITDVYDFDSIGLFDPATSFFALRCSKSTGAADYTFGYGEPGGGWTVLTGDWNGDGQAGVGLYDPETSTFYLTNAYQTGFAEYVFGYGEPGAGWVPLVGDWNGDGRTGVGLYDPASSTFYLTDMLRSGFAQYMFGCGEPGAGWTPLAGDWNGDGRAGVGLYNPQASTFYLTNAFTSGFAEYTFGYGEPNAGWKPLVGDWNGNGASGVGLYDPSSSTFYLTDTLASGYAEYTVGFGQPNAGWQPLVGCWGAASSAATPAAAAVDKIDLGDVAGASACATSLTDLDSPCIGSASTSDASARATDLALAGL
jgi:hypothetical protein